MQQPGVKEYVETSRAKSDMERMELIHRKDRRIQRSYTPLIPLPISKYSGLDFRLCVNHLWHRCNYVRPRA